MTTNVSYQLWHVGMRFPAWDIPLATDEGPDDITGVSVGDISLYFRNTTTNPPTDTLGTGTITIMSYNPAEIFYKPSAADVASVFTGQIVIKINYPPSHTSTDESVFDPIPFSISY